MKRRKWRMHRHENGRLSRIVVAHGVDGYVVRWTEHCSGCTETPEMTTPEPRGIGCKECGYCGKRVHVDWVPIDYEKYEKQCRKEDEECRKKGLTGTSAGKDNLPRYRRRIKCQ